jgi:hypothetical protein
MYIVYVLVVSFASVVVCREGTYCHVALFERIAIRESYLCLIRRLQAAHGLQWAGVERRPLTGLLYPPLMMHDDCGAVSGMNDWQGKPK